MFLKKLNLRLTLLFSIILLLSFFFLFLFSSYTLYSTLRIEDHRVINLKIVDYWARFQTGGMSSLMEELNVQNLFAGEKPIFVRILDKAGRTLYFNYPLQWNEFDFTKLENQDYTDPGVIIPIKSGDLILETAMIALSEEYKLQVGISTTGRNTIIDVFQRNILLFILVLLPLSLLVGTLIASRALKPVHNLTLAFKNIINTGKTSEVITAKGSGKDLDELTKLFNNMLARINLLLKGMKDTIDTVAHDIRTPMTRIRGIAELALSSPNGDVSREEALSDCIEESDRLLTLLNTLIEISGTQTGVITLKKENGSFPDVIREAIDVYRFIAEEKGIDIELDCSEEFTAAADRVRIRQAIGNLLDNSIKYSPEKGIIKILISKDEDYAVVRIKDEGPGITEDEMPKIWNKLYRGSKNKAFIGLGLGLSIVKAIVEAHNGIVDVVSENEQGSEFILRIPLS